MTFRPVLLLAFVVGGLACSRDEIVISPLREVSATAFVTPALATLLDADGLFPPPIPLELPYSQISSGRARELADAYRRIHLPGLSRYLSERRGLPINSRSLSVCGRTYYSESVLEPPDGTIPIGLRRGYGPYWIVTLCDTHSRPAISLAVSAGTADIDLVDGMLVYPTRHGSEFFAQAVSASNVEGLPNTPESAVATAGAATNRRITMPPRLVTLPQRAPQRGLWLLYLDKPIRVRSQIGNTTTSTVLIGNHRGDGDSQLWIPAERQPEAYQIGWQEFTGFGQRPISRSAQLRRRPEIPLMVQPVLEVLND